MLPRPKRFELIECNPVFLSIAETLGAEFQTPPRLASKQQDDSEVTVHGTGFRHPCRNDELWVSLTYLCITMRAGAWERADERNRALADLSINN